MARGVVLLVLLSASLLTGCDDARLARAQKGAEWLRLYVAGHPPNKVWKTREIRVDEDKVRLVMDVEVPNANEARHIRGLRKIEAVRVVQLACPDRDAELWAILGKDLTLWIYLYDTEGMISGFRCQYGHTGTNEAQ